MSDFNNNYCWARKWLNERISDRHYTLPYTYDTKTFLLEMLSYKISLFLSYEKNDVFKDMDWISFMASDNFCPCDFLKYSVGESYVCNNRDCKHILPYSSFLLSQKAHGKCVSRSAGLYIDISRWLQDPNDVKQILFYKYNGWI